MHVKEQPQLTKHEQAIKFADVHINLDDKEFWELADKLGFSEDDFIDNSKEEQDEKTIQEK